MRPFPWKTKNRGNLSRNIDGYTLTTRKIHGTTHYSVEEKLALAS